MSDDDLGELARLLREGAGSDLRAEAAEDEELTEVGRRRRRRLADVARQAMHRGDLVTVRAGGLQLNHPVVAVGSDYLTMESDDRMIDVRLESATLEVESRPSGGISARPGSATFRARLAEHEQDGAEVEIVDASGHTVGGRLAVVAADHIVVAGERSSYVPIAVVAVVFSRRPGRRG